MVGLVVRLADFIVDEVYVCGVENDEGVLVGRWCLSLRETFLRCS